VGLHPPGAVKWPSSDIDPLGGVASVSNRRQTALQLAVIARAFFPECEMPLIANQLR
jgi:hypothetical protein